MSPDQIEEARRAVERVRDDLGEHKVRAGRDHEVLEAARWASVLLRDGGQDRLFADILRRFIAADLEFTEVQFGRELVIDGAVPLSENEAATIQRAIKGEGEQ